MAVFEVKKETNKNLSQLYKKLNYIMDCRSTNKELVYGSAVSCIYPYEEMLQVKQAYNQDKQNMYRHYIVSLEEEDLIEPLKFRDIAIQICESIARFEGRYQVVMAVHINTDNLHAHYIANNIDYLTGRRLDLNRNRLYELKYKVNQILQNNQLSAIRMHFCG